MNVQDVFVGAVSCILGSGAVAAAVFNWDWLYRLKKARWLESRCGRVGARWTFASLGVFLILLGITVASGFRWRPFATSLVPTPRILQGVAAT